MKYTKNLRINGDKVFSYATHVATINHAERTLTIHGWHSVTTSKHVNHVADELGLKKIKGDAPEQKVESNGADWLQSVGFVAKLGNIFAPEQKANNDWKARMLKAGLGNRGLSMPENWDQLSEDEKSKRLEKVIEVLK